MFMDMGRNDDVHVHRERWRTSNEDIQTPLLYKHVLYCMLRAFAHSHTAARRPSYLHPDILTVEHSTQLLPFCLELQRVLFHLICFCEHIIELFPSLQYLVDIVCHHVFDFFDLALDL